MSKNVSNRNLLLVDIYQPDFENGFSQNRSFIRKNFIFHLFFFFTRSHSSLGRTSSYWTLCTERGCKHRREEWEFSWANETTRNKLRKFTFCRRNWKNSWEITAWCSSLLKIRNAHTDKAKFTQYRVGSRAEQNVQGAVNQVRNILVGAFGFVIENRQRRR